MPEPLPLPMRVLVKGPSTVVWTSTMGGPRSDFTFPRSIEAHLLAAGQAATVRTEARPSDRSTALLRNWQQEILAWSPDVVVLMYGHYEVIHYVLPWWLERHAQTLTRRPGPIRERYRKHILRPTWMALTKLQAGLDSRCNSMIRKRHLRRTVAHVERLIERAQMVASPLVVVMEIPPPARRWSEWFPGIAERIEFVNGALEDVVKRMDKPSVRFFRTTDVIARHFPSVEDATPDGGHFSAKMHREVGKALSEEILAWAAEQSHLHGWTAD